MNAASSGCDDERRAARRVNVTLRCWLASESITLLGSTLNLSESGVLVTAPLRLPVGRVVDISFATPGSEVTVQGKVVWSMASLRNGAAGLGLQFLSAPEPLETFLHALNP